MKKLLLLLIVYTTSFATLKAQGTWAPRASLPDSSMDQGISGFSIGNYGYTGLGEYNSIAKYFDYLWQFNPATNSWAQKANFPGSARVAPASFVIGNNAYLVTGSVANDGKCVKECWEYNSITNTWKQKASFPGGARTYATAFSIGGKGYVGTGANELSDFYKDFYSYDTATDTWTKIADFGGIARSGANGFAVNGKGYVCFGQDSNIFYYGDMWEYDTGTNSWTRKNNIPSAGTPHLAANGFVICNNIYVGGGVDSANNFNHTFWKYSTTQDSWTQVASVPGIAKAEGVAFAIADSGYYGFGLDSMAVTYNIFDRFYGGDSCSILTGVNAINDISGISIYPNPFTRVCYIHLPDNLTMSSSFSLIDVEGMEQKIDIQGNSSSYTLQRGNLKDGIYILSIKCNEQVFHKKLIIIN
jgi:N-acetylneuraminic acid mutarotase